MMTCIFEVCGFVKNTETWTSWERNVSFSSNNPISSIYPLIWQKTFSVVTFKLKTSFQSWFYFLFQTWCFAKINYVEHVIKWELMVLHKNLMKIFLFDTKSQKSLLIFSRNDRSNLLESDSLACNRYRL